MSRRVDPVGKEGKGHRRGSARTMVQVAGRGGTHHERPPGRHRRTRRSATRL
jgi:acetylornithine deacetylase/succinyl-diaminopimelate desuccinylase-like protein